jgi:hypothetical protein
MKPSGRERVMKGPAVKHIILTSLVALLLTSLTTLHAAEAPNGPETTPSSEAELWTHIHCVGPPSFDNPFRWVRADAKPLRRANESRWAPTPAHYATILQESAELTSPATRDSV